MNAVKKNFRRHSFSQLINEESERAAGLRRALPRDARGLAREALRWREEQLAVPAGRRLFEDLLQARSRLQRSED